MVIPLKEGQNSVLSPATSSVATATVGRNGYLQALISFVKESKPSKYQLHQKKLELAKVFGVQPATDIEILLNATPSDLPIVTPYLITKPVRTLSGVSVVAVMSAPLPCPHGKCTFCPGGPKSAFGDTPQSYTGHEPSTMRGKRNEYNAFRIVFNRLEHYVATGHHPDKCDVIIMGGTFPSYDKSYREHFVKCIYAALNSFSRLFYFEDGSLNITAFRAFFELPGSLQDKERIDRVTAKVLALYEQVEQKTLQQHMKENERAVCRCIGLTQETKPDWGLFEHGNDMLSFGTTRVEVGVQTLFDDVLDLTHRGHTLQDTVDCFRILKDLGFKINAHMMLGMPGVDEQMDEQSLRGLFEDERFKPDMVKIYPTLVIKGTALHYAWKKGMYTPLAYDGCVQLLGNFFSYVPRYCRVMRIQRDIPSTVSEAGVTKTNLRQDVDRYIVEKGIIPQDIRAREIKNTVITEPEYRTMQYRCSGGDEFFISVDDKTTDKIIGFIRMRYPGSFLRPEITPDSALIRELHVYGNAVKIGDSGEVQHRGFGKQLLALAEKTAVSHGKKKMVIISGIGVRQYYEKQGYHNEGPYMVKYFEDSV